MDDAGEWGAASSISATAGDLFSATAIVCKSKVGTDVATRGDVEGGSVGGGRALYGGGAGGAFVPLAPGGLALYGGGAGGGGVALDGLGDGDRGSGGGALS